MLPILGNNYIHIVVSKKIEHKIVHKKNLIQKHASQACLILICFYAILSNPTSFKGCLPAKTDITMCLGNIYTLLTFLKHILLQKNAKSMV